MKNRVVSLFEKKKKNILSVFYTAGFPSLNATKEIAEALQQGGVDMIELGIPFSDPVADGPTIQASNKIALDNGMTVTLLLEQLKQIRKTVSVPILLMGYLNPVLQYGIERFVKDAAAAGADGFILPDLPLDEYLDSWQSLVEQHGLVTTFLISPTTSEERIRKVDAATKGFIYAVSSSSTTGTRTGFDEDQVAYFKRLQSMQLKNSFLIGFGVSNRETYQTVCEYANGAIIGSAFIKLLQSSTNHQQDIQTFISQLK
ncbi:MAG: tryptophan synthase subunit alpha [Cyclobacteriaceae bacterium]|jgi:tryptophan synthase alpha chain|nr:tryptophan synthase subunit alpha [Flammeovirgaceae bacterium]